SLHPTRPPFAPELCFPVSPVCDEGKKLPIGYRRTSDAKGFDFDGMRPFFVVESKRKVRSRADQESSAGNLGITWERTGRIAPSSLVGCETRRGVAEGLPRGRQRFGMHAFMERGEQIKVNLFRRELGSSVDMLNAAIENLIHIPARVLERG